MVRSTNQGSREATASPTIKQVAEQAGVSTATVSRVLSGGKGVTEDTIKRVRQVVKSLDYHPNRVARNLRARKTNTVGLILSDIQNPFFTSVVRGVEDVLQAAGYVLLLGNSDDDPHKEETYLATFRAEGLAGIIFVISDVAINSYRRILAAGIPLVAIDRAPANLEVDLVTVSNVEGAQEATTHLIRREHKRIGMISGPSHLNTSRERQMGYEQALSKVGIPIKGELIKNGDFRETGGYTEMKKLLSLKNPPTAVFVANNLMTLGALQAIHEQGLVIPSQISLISFDDMPWAKSFQPPLTAIAQPTYELGSTAAELLLARMQDPQRPIRHVVLRTQLIVRASCG